MPAAIFGPIPASLTETSSPVHLRLPKHMDAATARSMMAYVLLVNSVPYPGA
jgi:hypothetical protein